MLLSEALSLSFFAKVDSCRATRIEIFDSKAEIIRDWLASLCVSIHLRQSFLPSAFLTLYHLAQLQLLWSAWLTCYLALEHHFEGPLEVLDMPLPMHRQHQHPF